MPARGGSFKDLRRKLDYVQSLALKSDVGKAVGAAAMKLVSDGFLGEHDPYGVPWRSLASRNGKILRKTGRMWRSTASRTNGNRTTIAITAWYSIIHQKGAQLPPSRARLAPVTARGRFMAKAAAAASQARGVRVRALAAGKGGAIPARPMVPDERGLPASWDRVFVDETIRVLRRGGS